MAKPTKETIRQQEQKAMQEAHLVLCDILRYAGLPHTGRNKVRAVAERLYAAMNGMPYAEKETNNG